MIHSSVFEELGVSGDIRVFRDDLYPMFGGGSKGRKMHYLAQTILDDGCDAVVTTGGIQSNHCRAVALFAAKYKMACTLVLHGDRERFSNESGNARIMWMSGARLVFVSNPDQISSKLDDAVATYQRQGHKPYLVPGGGHTLPGGKAYIDVIAELARYMDEAAWVPDYIFLASGTGSTQAGMLAGLDKYNIPAEVIGISVGRESARAESIVSRYYVELCEEYGIACSGRNVRVDDSFLAGGYGKYDHRMEEISRNSISRYGFVLDTTYTAKAFCGMAAIAPNLGERPKLLFWHTGGLLNFLA